MIAPTKVVYMQECIEIKKNIYENSDVDILVEFEKAHETFDNYMDLKFYLEELFGRKVDLVIIDSIKPALRSNILRSAEYAKGA